MPWYYGTIIGALGLVTLNSMKRGMDLTFVNFLILLMPLMVAQMGFWYGFRHAPKFINCWFLGTACTASLGIFSGLIFFDHVLTLKTVAGVVAILIGAGLLL